MPQARSDLIRSDLMPFHRLLWHCEVLICLNSANEWQIENFSSLSVLLFTRSNMYLESSVGKKHMFMYYESLHNL